MGRVGPEPGIHMANPSLSARARAKYLGCSRSSGAKVTEQLPRKPQKKKKRKYFKEHIVPHVSLQHRL